MAAREVLGGEAGSVGAGTFFTEPQHAPSMKTTFSKLYVQGFVSLQSILTAGALARSRTNSEGSEVSWQSGLLITTLTGHPSSGSQSSCMSAGDCLSEDPVFPKARKIWLSMAYSRSEYVVLASLNTGAELRT